MADRRTVRRLRGAEAVDVDGAEEGDGWARAFAVPLRQDDHRSSEQLARAMLQEAPAPVRRVLVAGWRLVLGLRLVTGPSSRTVLGWSMADPTDEQVVLHATSHLVTARKVIRRVGPDLVVATSVRYENRWGRLVWRIVLPCHLLIEPRLLARAAASAPRLGTTPLS